MSERPRKDLAEAELPNTNEAPPAREHEPGRRSGEIAGMMGAQAHLRGSTATTDGGGAGGANEAAGGEAELAATVQLQRALQAAERAEIAGQAGVELHASSSHGTVIAPRNDNARSFTGSSRTEAPTPLRRTGSGSRGTRRR